VQLILSSMCMSLCASCAGGCLSSAFADCSRQKTGFMSRVPYIFLFFVSGMFAIFMALYGEKEWLNLPFMNGLTMCSSSTCEGNGSVYRVSFLLFVFELLHVVVVAAGAVDFHSMWFCLKFFVFAGCLVLTFVVGGDDASNEFFYGFAVYFARYVSAIYLLIQIMILILLGYNINDKLVDSADAAAVPDSADQDEDERSHRCNGALWALAGGAIALYVGAFTLCGFFFVWYGDVDSSECGGHRTFIGMTIVMVVLNAVFSIAVGSGYFFVSAVVSFYCTFLCFAALQADDNEACNVWAGSNDTASLWIGFVFTFVAIFAAAFRADHIALFFESGDEEESSRIDMGSPLLSEEESARKSKGGAKGDSDLESGGRAEVDDSNYNDADDDSTTGSAKSGGAKDGRLSNVRFHFVMTLASCYLAMLLTSWGTGSTLETTGRTSLWVNIVCQYMTALLFWWTLCAPKICPSRFGSRDEDD